MGGVNGVVKYTVVDSPRVPPLTPVSLLKQVGAVIDLNNNTMELKKIGATTALRILPTGHVAHKLTEFASGGWKAPTPEQTKLFQARSDVFRPVTLPGESKQRRQYQIADFSSGLAYTVSNHSHVSPCRNICACGRCDDDQSTGDCSSGAVLTQKPSTCERSFASGFDVDANSEMGKSHIDRRVSVATTYPAMPRSCHSGSMASRHRHVARGILPSRANRVHTSTGTSCLSSQSMGINGRMRQKTRRMWRHPQLFPYSYGVCTEEREDQRESKEERQCQHQSKSSTDRQWSVGRKREGQRLSKVQPRALCVADCRWTDHALSRMGPHWDAVYIDQGVSRRGRQFQRQKYQPYRRWRFGDWFWWPVRRSTRRLGDEYFARTRRWIPKSNSQQRLDSSDASPDVRPRVGARTIRSVAAHSPTMSTPSIPAAARSVIQPGVVEDVPSPQRERQVHWGPVEHWIREWTGM